ncbi:MAG: hypothetical protein L0227_00710 [Chloroflexi bacterium]|nr:hypothetical protein [Chloroflexota bacterium]
MGCIAIAIGWAVVAVVLAWLTGGCSAPPAPSVPAEGGIVVGELWDPAADEFTLYVSDCGGVRPATLEIIDATCGTPIALSVDRATWARYYPWFGLWYVPTAHSPGPSG